MLSQVNPAADTVAFMLEKSMYLEIQLLPHHEQSETLIQSTKRILALIYHFHLIFLLWTTCNQNPFLILSSRHRTKFGAAQAHSLPKGRQRTKFMDASLEDVGNIGNAADLRSCQKHPLYSVGSFPNSSQPHMPADSLWIGAPQNSSSPRVVHLPAP